MAKRVLLMTRPEPDSQHFAARLSHAARAAVELVISPLLQIVPTGNAWNSDAAAVVFTSANAVHFAGRGNGTRAYCVGKRTAQAAIAAGWNVVETEQTAEALLEKLQRIEIEQTILHLAGQHRRGDIVERLVQHGIDAHVAVLYDQQLCDLNQDARSALNHPTIAPLFSPRTAMQLRLQNLDLSNVHAIALSPAVAAELGAEFSGKCDILSAPRGDLMVEAVEKLCLGTTMP